MQDREWPSSTPCCVWSKEEALGQICMSPSREEGRALLCCSPAGITPGSNPCNSRWPHNPATQGLQSWRWLPGNYVQICKLFHYVAGMKWHRADKSLAATEMGKVKRTSKRDAKLPHPIFALCVGK